MQIGQFRAYISSLVQPLHAELLGDNFENVLNVSPQFSKRPQRTAACSPKQTAEFPRLKPPGSNQTCSQRGTRSQETRAD